MHNANSAPSELANANTQSLLLKLTFHLQMNSGMEPLGGWRHRDTLRTNRVQNIMTSDLSSPNLQVCAEFLHFLLVLRTIRGDSITQGGFIKMKVKLAN